MRKLRHQEGNDLPKVTEQEQVSQGWKSSQCDPRGQKGVGAPGWGLHTGKEGGEPSILAQHKRPFRERKHSVS